MVRVIGRGGMGTVYEAMQLRLNKRVAIKIMAGGLVGNPEAVARFRREAEVTSAIGHPHIVQVFDFGTAPGGEPYLVMELLEGEDLEARVHRVGHLSLAATVRIAKQVASALSAAHRKGIIHRDLKPGNVYLLDIAGEEDFAKVLDFGISKVMAHTTGLTRTSRVMGTPRYMSREQAEGLVEQIDERTDQWALAGTVWEALSGSPPFVANDALSTLYAVVFKKPAPPLTQRVRGLPAKVEQVLLRAMSKDKLERFPSVMDFALALEEAAKERRLSRPTTLRQLGPAFTSAVQGMTAIRYAVHPEHRNAATTLAGPPVSLRPRQRAWTPARRTIFRRVREWRWWLAGGVAALLLFLLLFGADAGALKVETSGPLLPLPASSTAAEAPHASPLAIERTARAPVPVTAATPVRTERARVEIVMPPAERDRLRQVPKRTPSADVHLPARPPRSVIETARPSEDVSGRSAPKDPPRRIIRSL